MILRTLGAAALLVLLALPAGAFQCPSDIGKIDAALAANSTISDEDRATVVKLRNEGEELHGSGKHAESVAILAQAKALLGIE